MERRLSLSYKQDYNVPVYKQKGNQIYSTKGKTNPDMKISQAWNPQKDKGERMELGGVVMSHLYGYWSVFHSTQDSNPIQCHFFKSQKYTASIF